MFKYIPDSSLPNLEHYRYSCTDHSILCRLFMNRFYNWALHFLPVWLAPNVITLLAFCATLSGYVAISTHARTLEGEAPRWVYAYCGFSVLLYMTLDSLDGKQARRTGSSSPLGELFDHGVDALNTVVSLITAATTFQVGAKPIALLVACYLMGGFFLAAFEEYHTGTLVHPWFSLPTEGLITVALLLISTAVMGPAVWTQSAWTALGFDGPPAGWSDLPCSHLVIGVTLVLGSLLILRNIAAVLSVKASPPDDIHHTKHGHLSALAQLVPITSLFVAVFAWDAAEPRVFIEHPQLFLVSMGLIFARQTGYMITSHLVLVPYRNVLVFPYAFVLAAYNAWLPSPYVNPVDALFLVAAAAAITYVHFAYTAVTTIVGHLGISVFTIKPKMAE